MADDKILDPNAKPALALPSGKVVFTDYHRPALPSGDFKLHLSQSIKATGRLPAVDEKPAPPSIDADFEPLVREFSVLGPRFALPPDLTAGQFPPQGSLGSYHNVLPHVSFARASLPWERFAHMPLTQAERDDNSGEISDRMMKTPWLALLLFDEDELPAQTGAKSAPASAHRISAPQTVRLTNKDKRDPWSLLPEAPEHICSPWFPYEYGQKKDDRLTVIDVPRALLTQILPTQEEVALLAHVRHAEEDNGKPVGTDVATLICNRLPQKGKKSVLYVVSLEPEYGPKGTTLWDLPQEATHIRLVTLGSWNFTCLNPRHSFTGLIHHLNKSHIFNLQAAPEANGLVSPALEKAFLDNGTLLPKGTPIAPERPTWQIDDFDARSRFFLRLASDGALQIFRNETVLAEIAPGPNWLAEHELDLLQTAREACLGADTPVKMSSKSKIHMLAVDRWRIEGSETGPAYWVHLNGDTYEVHEAQPHVLRLSSEHLDAAKDRVSQGNIGVAHQMRNGDQTVSWYRGPLAPGGVHAPKEAPDTPRSADQLARYDQTTGMFTQSYAAAWELGRLLTLKNQKVAISLMNWKRQYRQSEDRKKAEASLGHLPIIGRKPASSDTSKGAVPEDVQGWFADLALLRNVPFQYLVPDPEQLPPESMRFFQVDPYWVRCLQDGAFSVGRVLPLDHDRDQAHTVPHRLPSDTLLSGLILRSELVSGWPDLEFEAYDSAIPHENYEAALQPPKDGVTSYPKSTADLQNALSAKDDRAVAAQFGINAAHRIRITEDVPNQSWLINLNHNAQMYRLKRGALGFQLWIEDRLQLLRKARLSPNLLLYLFAGDLKSVDIHQRPRALHFGFSYDEEKKGLGLGAYHREMKSHVGTEIPHEDIPIPASDPKRDARRTIPIENLMQNIRERFTEFSDDAPNSDSKSKLEQLAINAVGEDADSVFRFKSGFRATARMPFKAAQTALQLTEGVQKVRFVVSEANPENSALD